MKRNRTHPIDGQGVSVPRGWFLVVLWGCLCCWGSTSLSADVFRLKDGRRIEGTIVREVGDYVSIKTADKVITIDRSEIIERTKTTTAYDTYQEKLARVAADDVAAQATLAAWCERNALPAEATLHYKRVLALAPDHETAREKLGYIWFAGDWYLDGSAELEARRKELESAPADDLPSIPDRLPPPLPEKSNPLPPLPADAKTAALVLDEKIGRTKPDSSGAAYQVGRVLRTLDPPMRVSTGADPETAPLVIRVKVRTFFVRTQTFYNAPLYHIYQGELTAEILERQPDGTTRSVGRTQVKKPFSAGAKLEREKALEYTYHATIEAFASQLSRMSYLRQRGADPITEPKPRR